LKPKCDKLLPLFAFNFNLLLYGQEDDSLCRATGVGSPQYCPPHVIGTQFQPSVLEINGIL
jgi:hypothetical protein